MKRTKINLPKPLPCPHCGGTKLGQKYGPLQKLWWIECQECKAQGPPHQNDVESIDVWNMRAGD
ncbi:MAG: Lar family restriction alleviation protein [Planctomycetota bacterium]